MEAWRVCGKGSSKKNCSKIMWELYRPLGIIWILAMEYLHKELYMSKFSQFLVLIIFFFWMTLYPLSQPRIYKIYRRLSSKACVLFHDFVNLVSPSDWSLWLGSACRRAPHLQTRSQVPSTLSWRCNPFACSASLLCFRGVHPRGPIVYKYK